MTVWKCENDKGEWAWTFDHTGPAPAHYFDGEHRPGCGEYVVPDDWIGHTADEDSSLWKN